MKPLWIARLAFAGALLALGLSQAMIAARRYVPAGEVDFARTVPRQFAGWHEVPAAYVAVDPSDSGADNAAKVYDRIDYRNYRRADGAEVLLTLAYRRVQQQEGKIHRPELCYFAQGFVVGAPRQLAIPTRVGTLPALSFVASSPERGETILYWVRIGDRISTSAWTTRLHLIQLGFEGIVPDGMLVRASIVSAGVPTEEIVRRNQATLAAFLADLTAAVREDRRWLLSGGGDALRAADEG